MITVIQSGHYRLIETTGHVKILTLDHDTYAWVVAKNIGEILVASHKPHHTDHILATGTYRLYEAQDEPELADQQHLELNVGNQLWQGYVLPTGLPSSDKVRTRIIPSREVLSRPRRASSLPAAL